jgi:AcrR family transcriptional regulator
MVGKKNKLQRGRPVDPQRRRARRRALADSAFSLFLDRGLEPVTIDQIVNAAGLSKGTFYHHFDNKEALLRWVYEPLARQIEQAFTDLGDSLATDRERSAVRGAYELFAARMGVATLRDPLASRLFLQERRGPAVGARQPISELAASIEAHAVRTSELAAERGLLRHDPAIVGHAVIGAIENVLHALVTGRLSRDVGEVAAQMTQLVLDGMLGIRR